MILFVYINLLFVYVILNAASLKTFDVQKFETSLKNRITSLGSWATSRLAGSGCLVCYSRHFLVKIKLDLLGYLFLNFNTCDMSHSFKLRLKLRALTIMNLVRGHGFRFHVSHTYLFLIIQSGQEFHPRNIPNELKPNTKV